MKNTEVLEHVRMPIGSSAPHKVSENGNRIFTVFRDGELVVSEYSLEQTLEYIDLQAKNRFFVAPEGPAIYLYPPYESMEWQRRDFISGWNVTNEIMKMQRVSTLREYVLIDDFNFRPHGRTKEHDAERVRLLAQSSEVLAVSPLGRHQRGEGEVKIFSEREIANKINTTDCAVIDAQVNLIKIIDALTREDGPGIILKRNIDKAILFPIAQANTTVTRHEQSRMLASLSRKLVNHPKFYPGQHDAFNTISEMFRHIWIGEDGRIEQITQPRRIGDKWAHQQVSLKPRATFYI